MTGSQLFELEFSVLMLIETYIYITYTHTYIRCLVLFTRCNINLHGLCKAQAITVKEQY